MKRLFFGLLAVFLVAVLGVILSRELLARACMRRLTGVTAEVHPRRFNWKRGQFEVRNFVCTNLTAAGASIRADVPWLLVEYEPLSLLRRELHVYEISCDIRLLEISRPNPRSKEPREPSANRASNLSVRVDTLRLKLDGQFVYGAERITGKMQATLHDVHDLESLRAVFKRP